MVRIRALLVTVLATLPLGARPAEPPPVTGSGGHCALQDAGSERATSESCTRCHAQRQAHPYDVDYARTAAERSGLAPAAEVVRAGVLLPNGEIRCVTCHDRHSPWRYRIALPPGSKPSPSVDARMRAGTLDHPDLDPAAMPPGSEVTATPLCKVCHRF